MPKHYVSWSAGADSTATALLAQAALKLRRAMTGINPTPVTREAAESNLDEEISDTALCLELLGLAADQRTMEAKLARWRERLEGGR